MRNTGKEFEGYIMNAASRSGWSSLRIPDGCRQIGKKIVRVKSPFDFVFSKNISPLQSGHIFCDAKTTNQKHFGSDKIKDHQIQELHKFATIHNTMAGYLVNYEMDHKVVFFSVAKLMKSFRTRQMLLSTDGITVGNKFKVNFDILFQSKDLAALGTK